MAVKIRLARLGNKGKPFYRVVVADSKSPRDSKHIEVVGTYNPLLNPAEIKIDAEKVNKWLANGAKPTETAKAVLVKGGVKFADMKQAPSKKITAPKKEAKKK